MSSVESAERLGYAQPGPGDFAEIRPPSPRSLRDLTRDDLDALLRSRIDQKRFFFHIKRMFDVVASAFGLVFLAPALLVIAIVVKLQSPGPVLYSQLRHGKGGRPFRIYKFRTLYEEQCDESGIAQTCPGDPRVTPFGRLIRSASLDELPQLWNVLRGEMSLVGPRPHPIGMLVAGTPYEELATNYALRHLVRPGLTGLAQANGIRGPATNESVALVRIDYDLSYIASCSPPLETRILVKTLMTQLVRPNDSPAM